MKRIKIILLLVITTLSFLSLFQNFVSNNYSIEEIAKVKYKSSPLDSFIGPSGSSDENIHSQSLYISFPYIKSNAEVIKINFNKELSQAISLQRIPLSLPELSSWRTEQSWSHAIAEDGVYFSSFGIPARLLKYDPVRESLTSVCQTNQGLVKIWSLAKGVDNEIYMGASGENGKFYLYRYDSRNPQTDCEIVLESNQDFNEFDIIRNMVNIEGKIYLGLGSKKPGLAVFNPIDSSVTKIDLANCEMPGWVVFGKSPETNGWAVNSSNKTDSDCSHRLSQNGFDSPLSISDDKNRKYSVKYAVEPNLSVQLKSKNLRLYPDINVEMTPNIFYEGNESFLFSLKALDDNTVLSSSMLPSKLFKIKVGNYGGSVTELGNVGSGEVYSYSQDKSKGIIYLGGYSTCSMMMAISISLNNSFNCIDNSVQIIPCSPGNSCASNGSWRPRQMLDVDNKIYIASQEGYGVQQSFLTIINKTNQEATTYQNSDGWFVRHQWIYSLSKFIIPQNNWKWIVAGTTQVPNQGSVRDLTPAKLLFWNSKIDQFQGNLGNLNPLLTHKMIELDFGLPNFVTREVGALAQYKNRVVGIATLEEIQKDSQNRVKYLSRFRNVLFISSEIKSVRDLDSLKIQFWSLERVSNFPFPFNSANISGDKLTLVNQKHILNINLNMLESIKDIRIPKDRVEVIYIAESNKRIQAMDYSDNYIWFTVGGKILRALKP